MPTYRIKDWSVHFENNRTREIKEMAWIPVPNRMDGDGYTELVDHADGAAHLGAWLAILQIASKCEERGTLMRDANRPHDPQSLARISRLPVQIFEAVLPRLVAIGWLEIVPAEANAIPSLFVQPDTPQETAEHLPLVPQEGAAKSQEGAPSRARAEQNRTEGNRIEKNYTHTLDAYPARARDAPSVPDKEAASPRVCVKISNSKFSKPELRRYGEASADARGQPLGEGWVTRAFKSGFWDDRVKEFYENGEVSNGARRRTFKDIIAELDAQCDAAVG